MAFRNYGADFPPNVKPTMERTLCIAAATFTAQASVVVGSILVPHPHRMLRAFLGGHLTTGATPTNDVTIVMRRVKDAESLVAGSAVVISAATQVQPGGVGTLFRKAIALLDSAQGVAGGYDLVATAAQYFLVLTGTSIGITAPTFSIVYAPFPPGGK